MQDRILNRSKRIAANTFLLYTRMLVVLLVSLYTSRMILQILGVTDFGIYSVVGGIVVVFNVLSASMSESTSRFLSYSIGIGDSNKLRGYFHNAKFVYYILGIITFLISIAVGLWLINNKLLIPSERINAARIVLFCSVFTFVVKISNTPYTALIISNERMGFYATLGIIEVLFRLLSVLLLFLIKADSLIVYALFVTLEPFINKLFLKIYCKKQFNQVYHGKVIEYNRVLFKDMINFAGWDMLGALERIMQDQGVNIIINFFCLPLVNSARAIAMQIRNAVVQFSTNFQVAVNPQIVKSYAEGDRDYMLKLIFKSCKYSFYLLLLIICPLITHTETILSIWLGQIPEHSVLFVRLVLLMILSDAYYEIMNQGAKATGNIKVFRIITSSVSLMNLPIAYAALSFGVIPEFTILITISLNIIVLIVQLLILRKQIQIDPLSFIKQVLLPNYLIAIIAVTLSLYTAELFNGNTYVIFIFHSIVSTVFLTILVYCLGITHSERSMLKGFVINRIKKIKYKN